MIKVEAEHNELILENSHGDKVIIPKDKRGWVKQKLDQQCYDCIDDLVSTLPTAQHYAEDGSLYTDYLSTDPVMYKKTLTNIDPDPLEYKASNEPEVTVSAAPPLWMQLKDKYISENPFDINKYVDSRFSNPLGSEKIKKINAPKWREELRQQGIETRYNAVMDYVGENLVKRKPQLLKNRGEWLDSFSEREEQIIKRNPKYQSTIWQDTLRGLQSMTESNPADTIRNIWDSSNYSTREKEEMIKEYANHPILSKFGDTFKSLGALTVPAKMVQSVYKKDYSLYDAIDGKKNNAGIVEDIVTDPLNLVGLGIWGDMSKAGAVINKLDDLYTYARYNKEAAGLLQTLVKETGQGAKYESTLKAMIKNMSTTDIKNLKAYDSAKRYFAELEDPKVLTQLDRFGQEFDIDLLKAYRGAFDRFETANSVKSRGNDKIKVAGEEIFSGGIEMARGVSMQKRGDMFMDLLNAKDLNEPFNKTILDYKYNYINKTLPVKEYDEVVWHELSHYINSHITSTSPKFNEAVSNIFESNIEKSAEKLKTSLKIISKKQALDIAAKETQYIMNPTETWAFLSTNLRQELKSKGLFKTYTDTLTPEILAKAEKQTKTYKRFSPYIKDSKAFIELFNKMTLSIAPIAAYLQSRNED